ncbi:sensor histidine kinase [Motilibacter peucedani]|nr:HAMP domain-containing sensor histidine kinase [Motilibacter peucedani]
MRSWPASRLWTIGWVVFSLANVVWMFYLTGRETVPFHFIWISLGLVYGFTVWRLRETLLALASVALVTGSVLGLSVVRGTHSDELFEIPLMTAVFAVMAWHVHRRQQAVAMAEALAAAEQGRRESRELFTRLASHELRTPITVARGYAELVRSAHPDPTTLQDTAIILDELDKIGRISERLLTIIEVQQGFTPELFDVDALLRRTTMRWLPTAERDWQVSSSVGSFHGPMARLETALDTLVENAVKFTSPGDRICLEGRVEDGDVVLEVSDTGAGIPGDRLPFVFLPFTTSVALGHGPGTGLGLTIVRVIVEQSGGTATVTSEVGAGTTVTLRLPRDRHSRLVPVETAGGGTGTVTTDTYPLRRR